MSARGQNDFSLICDSTGTSTGEMGSMLGCDSLPDNGNDNSDNDTDASDGSNNNSDNAGSNDASDHDDGHDPATMGTVEVNQMTGKIYLPTAASEPTRREIHVVVSTTLAIVLYPIVKCFNDVKIIKVDTFIFTTLTHKYYNDPA